MPWSLIESVLAPHFLTASQLGGVNEASWPAGPKPQNALAGLGAGDNAPLPIRLMTALLYLQNAYSLDDEELVLRWTENVQWQYFSGQDFYDPKPPCNAAQIERFRDVIGKSSTEELLKAMVDTAKTTRI